VRYRSNFDEDDRCSSHHHHHVLTTIVEAAESGNEVFHECYYAQVMTNHLMNVAADDDVRAFLHMLQAGEEEVTSITCYHQPAAY